MKTQPLGSSDESSDLQNEFVKLAEAYVAFAQEAGVRLSPYRSPSVPHFSKLNKNQKRTVIEDIRGTVEVFRSMVSEGQTLKDTPVFLWRTLKRFELTPCSDIFDKIGSDDVVLLFSNEHKILFHNLRFLEMVSFTIEEIYCTEWYLLTKRAEWAQAALYEAAEAIFSGKIQGTFDPGVRNHVAEETCTDGKVRLWVKVTFMSPVKRDNQIAGLIVLNQITDALSTDEF
jgi:hypothetical protein